jgi:hypothetical protein
LTDPANIEELAAIAREIGADVLEGALRYPSETGGWFVVSLDFPGCFVALREHRPSLDT